uniref:Lipoprotein n=1 Tax=Gracilinema caldarium TaxID=215591 RepID=A0A7C3IJR7_9SPIR
MTGISLKGFLHKIFRFISSMVLLVSLSSCWHPPFDPDVSASVLTAQKLGSPVLEIRTRLGYNARGGYYIPCRPDYNQGFWVVFEQNRMKLSQMHYDMVNQKWVLTNYTDYPVNDLMGLQLLPDQSSTNTLFISLTNLKGWYKITFGGGFTPFTAQGFPFLGAGYTLGDGTSEDTLNVAYLNGTQVDFSSVQTDNFTTILGPFAYTALPATLLESPTFAVMLTGGEAYISGLSADGSTVTYYWASNTAEPVTLLIDRPLTGMLSDGRLLSDREDRLYIYEKYGSSVFSIPTGALHFSFERYDSANSQWISVFTRTLEIATNREEWEYLISIYEIPTSRLAELAR